jgi:hypothetical protein
VRPKRAATAKRAALGPRPEAIPRWPELKLQIVQRYASAYSRIMSRQAGLAYYYIEGFSGAGVHLGALNGGFVAGSPLNALRVEPPFRHHFLLDLDGGRAAALRRQVGGRSDVTLLEGDGSERLLRDVLPQVRAEDYRRALCLLDPAGPEPDRRVIEAAGRLRTVDLFARVPIVDGHVAAAFGRWLREVARFENVLEPLPLRGDAGASPGHLFFASRTDIANHVIEEIFTRHRGQ